MVVLSTRLIRAGCAVISLMRHKASALLFLVALLGVAGAKGQESSAPPPVGDVSVETFCPNDEVVLARSRPDRLNGGEVAFVVSSVGAPGILVASSIAAAPLELEVSCPRISGKLRRAIELNRGIPGLGLVLEGIHEFLPESKFSAFDAQSRSLVEPHFGGTDHAFHAFHNFSSLVWTAKPSEADGVVNVVLEANAYNVSLQIALNKTEYFSGQQSVRPSAVQVTLSFDMAALRTNPSTYFAPQFIVSAPLRWTAPALQTTTAITDFLSDGQFTYTNAITQMDGNFGNGTAFVSWPNVAHVDDIPVRTFPDELSTLTGETYPYTILNMFSPAFAYNTLRFTAALQRPFKDGQTEWKIIVSDGSPDVSFVPDLAILIGIICGGLPVVVFIVGGLITCVASRKQQTPSYPPTIHSFN